MNPLIRIIPSFLVKAFANRYVAGGSLAEALATAASLLQERGLLASLDLLAEGIDDEATVQRNVETYIRMIDAVAGDERFSGPLEQPTISMKLSSYTTGSLHTGGTDHFPDLIDRRPSRSKRATGDMISLLPPIQSSTLILLTQIPISMTIIGGIITPLLHLKSGLHP